MYIYMYIHIEIYNITSPYIHDRPTLMISLRGDSSSVTPRPTTRASLPRCYMRIHMYKYDVYIYVYIYIVSFDPSKTTEVLQDRYMYVYICINVMYIYVYMHIISFDPSKATEEVYAYVCVHVFTHTYHHLPQQVYWGYLYIYMCIYIYVWLYNI